MLWLVNLDFAGGSGPAEPVDTPQDTPVSVAYPGGSAGGGQRQIARTKRERRLRDDQDLLDLVALAIPEILKRMR